MAIVPVGFRPRILRPTLVPQSILVSRGGAAPVAGDASVTLGAVTLVSAGTLLNSAVLLTSGVNTGSPTIGTSQATASITIEPNTVVYACVVNAANDGTATAATATGCGLTWALVNSQAYGAPRMMTVLRALGASPSAGAITFDWAAETQNSAAWIVIQCPGSDTSGTNGSGATVQSVKQAPASNTTLTNTLAALGSANNIHLAFTATRGTGGHTVITHDADFAELADVNTTQDAIVLEAQWARNQTDVTPTWTVSDVCGCISIEVKSA
jgi:hypothetical protein